MVLPSSLLAGGRTRCTLVWHASQQVETHTQILVMDCPRQLLRIAHTSHDSLNRAAKYADLGEPWQVIRSVGGALAGQRDMRQRPPAAATTLRRMPTVEKQCHGIAALSESKVADSNSQFAVPSRRECAPRDRDYIVLNSLRVGASCR